MAQPIRHSPLLAYLLLWPTAGFYWLFWLYRTMRDLNILHTKPLFDLRRIAVIAGGYLVLFYAVFALGISLMFDRSLVVGRLVLLLGFLMALGWFAAWAYLHARIGRAILELQSQKGVSRRASPALAVFLFFLYFVAVPYLQSHMNSVVDYERTG